MYCATASVDQDDVYGKPSRNVMDQFGVSRTSPRLVNTSRICCQCRCDHLIQYAVQVRSDGFANEETVRTFAEVRTPISSRNCASEGFRNDQFRSRTTQASHDTAGVAHVLVHCPMASPYRVSNPPLPLRRVSASSTHKERPVQLWRVP